MEKHAKNLYNGKVGALDESRKWKSMPQGFIIEK
jgi:hypothetical protein